MRGFARTGGKWPEWTLSSFPRTPQCYFLYFSRVFSCFLVFSAARSPHPVVPFRPEGRKDHLSQLSAERHYRVRGSEPGNSVFSCFLVFSAAFLVTFRRPHSSLWRKVLKRCPFDTFCHLLTVLAILTLPATTLGSGKERFSAVFRSSEA